jgi:hypothetical protein
MGLDCSHDAFCGAYSAFNRLRQEVARAMGGSWPPHSKSTIDGEILKEDKWYWGNGYNKETHPGLFEFMSHSDCDGDISPEMCTKVANDLEALLPKISFADAGGHLARVGGYRGALEKFIAGCRAAAAANEPLEFM